MLPGVPQLFRLQLERVLPELGGEPVTLRTLYLSCGEPEIAAALDRIALEHPHVAIGSYPRFGSDAPYRVKVTVEHGDPATADVVVELLQQSLPRGSIIRIE